MKKLIVSGCIATITLLASCTKSTSTTADTTTDLTTQLAALKAISVGTTSTGSTSASDSIYAVNTCNDNERKTIISFTSLSTSITDYLSTNYSGYTAALAVQITNSAGTITGYVAVISYNGNPVAVKFDGAGGFVKVLELRQGIDIKNSKRFHNGGCFDSRDGLQRDTVALSSLSSTITTYISTNYATDVLVKAFKTKNNYIVVVTKDATGVLYANVFNSNNVFVKRAVVHHRGAGTITAVAEAALLSNITTYLTTTYPGYTFNQAFSVTKNGVLKEYVVLIDANNSKYAVEFDASGNFTEVHTIF